MKDIKELIKEGKTEEEILGMLYDEAKAKYAEAAAQSRKDAELEEKVQAAASALEALFTFVNPNLKITGLDSWVKGMAKKAKGNDSFEPKYFPSFFDLFI